MKIITFKKCAFIVLATVSLYANDLNGHWKGVGVQTSGSSWTMDLVIDDTNFAITYPSLNCGGQWLPIELKDNYALLKEKITRGKSNCVDNGYVKIYLINDTLKFLWHYENMKLDATAKLSRMETQKIKSADSVDISAKKHQSNEYIGRWTGIGNQLNGISWTMDLKISDTSFNIEYPSLECGGIWIPQKRNGNIAVFREKITHGNQQCADNGIVEINRINDTLSFAWYDENMKIDATSKLTLRGINDTSKLVMKKRNGMTSLQTLKKPNQHFLVLNSQQAVPN